MSDATNKKFLDYIIKTTNGMAYGLFATLIIGSIIVQLGTLINKVIDFEYIIIIGKTLQSLMAVGIGVAVALTLKLDNLTTISIIGVSQIVALMEDKNGKANNNPFLIYLVVILTIIVFKAIFKKKTPIDILLIPIVMVIIGTTFGYILKFPIVFIMDAISSFIDKATTYAPIPMGIIISVVMGMALTMPISSVAIAIALGLNGISAGAAVVGCSVQMIGFCIMSRKDNNIGKVISVGIGTSMLQFKNILKKPIIWLPVIITSAILGPISTTIFKLECTSVGAGMGTCGLVGQFGVLDAMGYNNIKAYIGIILLHIILPIIIVYFIDLIFRKKQIIKAGDLEI